MRPENLNSKRESYETFKTYLLSLQSANGQPLFRSRRKTFIVGFVNTFCAVIMLADDLFSLELTYFPTFRISQDFIETLFSKIRRMGGCSSNPTPVLFRSALKKLLCKQAVNSSKSANSVETDGTSGLFSLIWSKRSAPMPVDADSLSVPDDKLQSQPFPANNIVKDNIIAYVAGYVVRSLRGSVKCGHCSVQLIEARVRGLGDHGYVERYGIDGIPDAQNQLLKIKDRGGLIMASQAVVSVCRRCEGILEMHLDTKFLRRASPAEVLVILLFRNLMEDQPLRSVFDDRRCEVEEGNLGHSKQLIRVIALKYFDIRIKHFVKCFNKVVIQGGKGKDRSNLSRLVIFKHQ